MTEKEIYKQCVLNGVNLEYNKVSLCDLERNKVRVGLTKKYQVWSNKFTKVYDSIDEAVDKFIELKDA